MRRFKIYDLRFMIFILSLLLFINDYSSLINPVYAVDSTPSANVQQKLHALQQEIASKAARLKTEIQKKLQNKVYVGVIKSKSATTLTLAARSGTKIVNINQDTVYEPNKKFKEEDRIVALGDVDETEVLTARKVVILPTSNLHFPTSILWGQVVSISDQLITVQDRSLKNIAVSISRVNTKVADGQFVIITGSPGKNDILAAKFIYVIPGKQAQKITSPSAQIATQSATPLYR